MAQAQVYKLPWRWPVAEEVQVGHCVVTPEGSRSAAPATWRSWAALPQSPLCPLMAIAKPKNKMWLRVNVLTEFWFFFFNDKLYLLRLRVMTSCFMLF